MSTNTITTEQAKKIVTQQFLFWIDEVVRAGSARLDAQKNEAEAFAAWLACESDSELHDAYIAANWLHQLRKGGFKTAMMGLRDEVGVSFERRSVALELLNERSGEVASLVEFS